MSTIDHNTVAVNVLIHGKEYSVACPRGQENALLASAKRVDAEMRRIRESGKVLGSDRIAVMVALNLAHELLQTQPSASPVATVADEGPILQKLQNMQDQIEAALGRYPHRPAA